MVWQMDCRYVNLQFITYMWFLGVYESKKKEKIESLVPDLDEMNFEGPNLLPIEDD